MQHKTTNTPPEFSGGDYPLSQQNFIPLKKKQNKLKIGAEIFHYFGARYYDSESGYFTGDMANITSRYARFQNAGMKNSRTWFSTGGRNTIFPKHYVYHKKSGNLYHYNAHGQSNVFIRNVTSPAELYYNLGF